MYESPIIFKNLNRSEFWWCDEGWNYYLLLNYLNGGRLRNPFDDFVQFLEWILDQFIKMDKNFGCFDHILVPKTFWQNFHKGCSSKNRFLPWWFPSLTIVSFEAYTHGLLRLLNIYSCKYQTYTLFCFSLLFFLCPMMKK